MHVGRVHSERPKEKFFLGQDSMASEWLKRPLLDTDTPDLQYLIEETFNSYLYTRRSARNIGGKARISSVPIQYPFRLGRELSG